MRFEHLVEINDFIQPAGTLLTRDQVWSGLMHRVEDSRPFMPGLDECRILAREESGIQRCLRFGTTEIFDCVLYAEERWVCFESQATSTHGGGRLTILLEEPQPMHLFLRFIYETGFALGAEQEDAPYADYLQQAYAAADIETVRVIRLLAAAGSRQ
jgi:hypothetical protein